MIAIEESLQMVMALDKGFLEEFFQFLWTREHAK